MAARLTDVARLHSRQLVKAILNYRGSRREILRGYMYDVLTPYSPSVAVESHGTWYFVPTNDYIGRKTFLEGSFDLDAMRRAIRFLEDAGHKLHGRTFVDVGANIGTSTIAALLEFGASDGIAVEPVPRNFRLLRSNLIMNGLEERVRAVQSAVSDAPGSATMELAPTNSGDYRVRPNRSRPGLLGEESWPVTEVPVTTLDNLLSEADIGLLWIDTQGHEPRVLAGAERLLSRGVPVVAEYAPYLLARAGSLDAYHDIVRSSFTTVVDVKSGRRLRAAHVTELASAYPVDEPFAYTDLLLT